MKYCHIGAGEAQMIFRLVGNVFDKFEAPDYPEEGIRTFKAFIEPNNLKLLMDQGWPFYGCFEHEMLVGVLAFRKTKSHISLLFVDERYHRQGIAKSLLALAMDEILKTNPEINEITVNSSPYAREIYEKMGFVATAELQLQDGLLFIPMSKCLTA